MDIYGIVLTAIAWYSIVGTIVGAGLIAFWLYRKYVKKQCAKKILVTGIALIGITVLIFLVFVLFGFMGLGFVQK